MRRSALAIALVSLLASCAPSPDRAREDVANSASRIIKGSDSDASQDAVVLVMHYDALQRGATDGCTGIMLTPELVLTARHCVSMTDDSAACDSDGTAIAGGAVRSDFRPTSLFVFAGNKRPSLASGLEAGVRGRELVTPAAKSICNNDLALILLDGPVPNAKIAPIRLDARAALRESVTVVGWGVTERTNFPATRQQRTGVQVIEVGPGEQLGPGEFKLSEGTCLGDSGGPAFAESSGAVLGVLSRGGNGTGASGAANCLDGENVYSAAAQHKDLILAAYEKAGQEPWLEGNPNPRLATFGGSCAADDGCQSGICNASTSVCTQACDDQACPSGFVCGAAEGRNVCIQETPKESSSDGCAVSETRTGQRREAGVSTLALALALALVLARRRERAR